MDNRLLVEFLYKSTNFTYFTKSIYIRSQLLVDYRFQVEVYSQSTKSTWA